MPFHRWRCVLISITACKCQQLQIAIFQFSIKMHLRIWECVRKCVRSRKRVRKVVKSAGTNPLLIYEHVSLTFFSPLCPLLEGAACSSRLLRLSVPRALEFWFSNCFLLHFWISYLLSTAACQFAADKFKFATKIDCLLSTVFN